jgi:hypothetical protein
MLLLLMLPMLFLPGYLSLLLLGMCCQAWTHWATLPALAPTLS